LSGPGGRGFRSPWWLRGGHAQTILPARIIPVARLALRRERWDTPDDDFLDIDYALPEPAAAEAPVLVMFHGLEGGSGSHYARVLMRAGTRRGWRSLVVHFRGCGGEENLLPRAYHSGDSAEVGWALAEVARRWPRARRFAVGISLGGNALAKWAGEQGAGATSVHACAAVSAPLDLVAGGLALEEPGNGIYTRAFLSTLRGKALAKARRFPGLVDTGRIERARTMREFDDAFTAPVHGFGGVFDYWTRASAKPWLAHIAIPTLVLNARNDPFIPADSLPVPGEVSASVTLEQPEDGGHVGFYGTGPGGWYLAERVPEFFAGTL